MKKEKRSRRDEFAACDLIGPLDNMLLIRPHGVELPKWCLPLTEPNWLTVAQADHMLAEDPVIALLVSGKSYAIPWWIMKNHHVANLTIENQHLLINLCEVCSGSAAFDPVVEGRRLNFRIEGAYKGTFIITDFETNGLWAPFTGECLHGPLKGVRLQRSPVYQSTWQEWAEMYPQTLVPDGVGESREGHGCGTSPGSHEDSHGRFEETQTHRDERLEHNTLVLGVEVDGHARAYPLEALSAHRGVINDALANEDIVLLGKPQSWLAMAFARELDGEKLYFERDEEGRVRDRNTGSIWQYSGEALAGPMQGRRLTYVNSGIEEWYAWAGYHPQCEIFEH
jgi:hypothetical protein